MSSGEPGRAAIVRMMPPPIMNATPANAALLSIQPGSGWRRLAEMIDGRQIVSATLPRRATSSCSAARLVKAYVFGYGASADGESSQTSQFASRSHSAASSGGGSPRRPSAASGHAT